MEEPTKIKGRAEEIVSVTRDDDTVVIRKGGTAFENDPAWVNYKLGATVNQGNYESARVDISITRPCVNEEKVIQAEIGNVKTVVETMIQAELQLLRNV